MENESNHRTQVGEEDLPILGFIPIWIFYSLTASCFDAKRITKIAMLKTLENHTQEEYMGLVGFFMGYLKTNLHKLHEYHYETTDSPDLSKVDSTLTSAIDLLQTKRIEQGQYAVYMDFLKDFTKATADQPFIAKSYTEQETTLLKRKAQQIINLLS